MTGFYFLILGVSEIVSKRLWCPVLWTFTGFVRGLEGIFGLLLRNIHQWRVCFAECSCGDISNKQSLHRNSPPKMQASPDSPKP